MKKITIGRNNTCDVIVPDTSNIVSRRQAVLTFTPWGRMTLYDTSNNGTYINGQKIEKGKGFKVTRKDRVNLGGVMEMDWDWVTDPYKLHKQVALWFGLAIFLLIIVFTIWILVPVESYQNNETSISEYTGTGMSSNQGSDNFYPLVIENKKLQLYY